MATIVREPLQAQTRAPWLAYEVAVAATDVPNDRLELDLHRFSDALEIGALDFDPAAAERKAPLILVLDEAQHLVQRRDGRLLTFEKLDTSSPPEIPLPWAGGGVTCLDG